MSLERGVSGGDLLLGLQLRLGAGGLEHGPPGGVRTATEERSALTLGHAAPHAPLDLVVERLGEALGAYRASGAQLLGLVLLGTTDEELVGLRLPARRAGGPVLDPHFSALPSPREKFCCPGGVGHLSPGSPSGPSPVGMKLRKRGTGVYG